VKNDKKNVDANNELQTPASVIPKEIMRVLLISVKILYITVESSCGKWKKKSP
jgi:hypothetical protein